MSYLIEFRFQSARVKNYLKRRIFEINRKFKVGKRKHVPHITLVGPITTRNEKKLISDFTKICSETKLMKFKLKGFGTFDNNRVVYVNIDPSKRLNDFRIKLTNTMKSYCNLQSKDSEKDPEKFGYHSTIAMKLSPSKFKAIKRYINRKSKPNYSQFVMRVTLLKRGRILREYDFLQRRLLNRRQSLNKYISRRSKELLKQFMKGEYDPNRNIKAFTEAKQTSFWDRIKQFFGF